MPSKKICCQLFEHLECTLQRNQQKSSNEIEMTFVWIGKFARHSYRQTEAKDIMRLVDTPVHDKLIIFFGFVLQIAMNRRRKLYRSACNMIHNLYSFIRSIYNTIQYITESSIFSVNENRLNLFCNGEISIWIKTKL